MSVWVRNAGTKDAEDVLGTLRCADTFVTLIDSVTSFGSIPAGDSTQGTMNLTFEVDTDAGDAHLLPFQLVITDSSTAEWTSNFTDVVKDLDLAFMIYTVNDASGDGDGVIDPGESVDVDITLENAGLAAGTMAQATLSTSDPFVDVDVDHADFSYLPALGYGTSLSPYAITVHSDCPDPYFFEMYLNIVCRLLYANINTFVLP